MIMKPILYEPGSLARARVRRIPAFLWAAFTTYVTILYFQCVVNYFSKKQTAFLSPGTGKRPLYGLFFAIKGPLPPVLPVPDLQHY